MQYITQYIMMPNIQLYVNKFDNQNDYNIKSYRQEEIRKESEQIWEKCGIYMIRTETKQED